VPAAEGARVTTAVTEASEQSFHLGIGVGGVLMIAGGILAGIGLRNPRKSEDDYTPAAATAGECSRVCAQDEEPAKIPA
jgi:hypothetical protein